MAFAEVTALGFTMASLVLSPIRRDAQLTCRPTKRRKLRHQQERKRRRSSTAVPVDGITFLPAVAWWMCERYG